MPHHTELPAAGTAPSFSWRPRSRFLAKRGFDLAAGVAALIMAVPVIAIAAAAVRIDSPGPAFFAQWRVGRNRRPFRLYKLRSMTSGGAGGAGVTAERDPRVTRVGRLLRRTRIDELPQLVNVIIGDMSLVGPRPELPSFVAGYAPEFDRLLSVRPGITDAATIAFRDEASLLRGTEFPEDVYARHILPAKARVSLAGLDQSSLTADLGLLMRTAAAIVAPRTSGEHPAFTAVREQLSTTHHSNPS